MKKKELTLDEDLLIIDEMTNDEKSDVKGGSSSVQSEPWSISVTVSI